MSYCFDGLEEMEPEREEQEAETVRQANFAKARIELISVIMRNMQCDATTAEELIRSMEAKSAEDKAKARAEQEAAKRKAKLDSADAPQWHGPRRAKPMMGPLSDMLVDTYSAMADDANTSAKKREAAMLFSVAEGHINDDENDRDAIKSAKESLAIYTELGDPIAEADAVRLLVHAYRMRADIARWLTEMAGDSVAEDTMKEAEALVTGRLSKYKTKGVKRGEAAMLLSLAELDLDSMAGGGRTTEEAVNNASQAAMLFQEVGDKKMEGQALLGLARVRCRRHRNEDAVESAKQALTVIQSIGDQKVEVEALHTLGVAYFMNHEVDKGLDYVKDALNLTRKLGNKKQTAFELITVAGFQLEKAKPKEAAPLCVEALEICKGLTNSRGLEALAEQTMVEAYLARDEVEKALDVATKGLERSQSCGDKREEVYSQTTLAFAHIANEDSEEAKVCADGALAVCQDLGDKSWEAKTQLTICQVCKELGDLEGAQKAGSDAADYFQSEGDTHHEAVASILISGAQLMKGDLDKALDSAEKGRSLFHGEEELDQEEIAIMGVAYAYALKGELPEAVKTAQEAVELAQDTKHKRGEVSALATLCEMHRLNNDLEAAVEAAKAMRKACQTAGDAKMESYSLYHLTTLHIAQGDGKLAVKAIESAVKLCQKEGQKRQQVHMLLLSAEARLVYASEMSEKATYDAAAQRTMGELTGKALMAVKDAVALATKVDSVSLQGIAHHWNAQIMLAMADTVNAMAAAEKARGFFQRAKDPVGEAYAIVINAKAYLQEQNRPKAQSEAEEALALFKTAEDKEGEDIAQDILNQCGFGQGGMGQMTPEMMEQWQAMQQAGGGDAGMAMAASAVVVEAKPKGLDPELTLQTVQELAKAAIGLDDAVYLDSPLMDSGMDSLTAVSFRNGLQQQLGVKLPSSLMFDYPTMKEVSNRIVELSLEE